MYYFVKRFLILVNLDSIIYIDEKLNGKLDWIYLYKNRFFK